NAAMRPSLEELKLVSLALPVAGEAGRNLHIPRLRASSFDTFFIFLLETLHNSVKNRLTTSAPL
ncbi:MAG: hypothetical protein ABGY95_12715, partial [Rubritalea sp.]|uniref:hypothetical protein n=1 Tax=Rubritalea sp. TaxID=2109375 RepID=UPI0032427A9A